MTVLILSLFDTGSFYYWRVLNLYPVVISILIIFLLNGPGKGCNPASYNIREYGVDRARELINEVHSEEYTDYKIKEYLDEQKIAEKGESPKTLCEVISVFKKEAILTFLAVGTFGLCNPCAYYSFSVLIGAKDFEDLNRIKIAK